MAGYLRANLDRTKEIDGEMALVVADEGRTAECALRMFARLSLLLLQVLGGRSSIISTVLLAGGVSLYSLLAECKIALWLVTEA